MDIEKQNKYLELYTPLAGNLFAFCMAKTHNREEAKDLVSETILASYENFHTIDNEKAFLSFLFTIATNINKAKYKKNQRFVLSEPEIFDTMYDSTILQDIKTDIKILFEYLDKLPAFQREAIYLFDIMGLTQKEIAKIQNTTVINIKLRIHRGKKKLAESLRDNIEKISPNSISIKLIQNMEA